MGQVTPVPLSAPDPTASFLRSLSRFFTRWSRFSGRASRREFWFPALVLFLLWAAFRLGTDILVHPGDTPDAGSVYRGFTADQVTDLVTTVVYAFLFLPALSLTWRRLHDAGFAGPWALLALVPVCIPVVLLMLARRSRPELMKPQWEDPGTRAASAATYLTAAQVLLLLLTVIFFVAGMNNVYLAHVSAGTALNNVDGSRTYMVSAAVTGGAFVLVFLGDLARRMWASLQNPRNVASEVAGSAHD